MKTIDELMQELRSDNSRLRFKAYVDISQQVDSIPSRVLINALNDDNVFVRRIAAEFLGDTKDKSAIPELLKVLNEKSLQYLAIISISHLVDPSMDKNVTLEIINAMKGFDYLTLCIALNCLNILNQPEGIEIIKSAAANDARPDIKKYANLVLQKRAQIHVYE